MRISLSATGLLDPRQLLAWSTEKRRAIHHAVARGMQTGGREVRDAARSEIRKSFNVKRNGFVLSMGAKVLDKKPGALPALLVGSKIPWLGIHETGGTINGRMLIPLLPEHQRIGRKAFRRVVDGLMRSGNAFFIKKNGKAILMAENIKENTSELRRFKRAERIRAGVKSIKRGQEIPIAVLVNRIDLKRRFNFTGAVQRSLPALARAIQQELDKV